MIISNNNQNPDMYLGSQKVKKIYLGDSAIYEGGDSPVVMLDYLTIESLADNNEISWNKYGSPPTKTIEWSTDQSTWTSIDSGAGAMTTLNTGDKLYLRGNNTQYTDSKNYYNYIGSSGNFNLSGNIMSLIYGSNFEGETELTDGHTFRNLFRGCKVVDASNLSLPATTLANDCYNSIFFGCSSLTVAPALPATTLAIQCYEYMFRDCSSLTSAPALPATTLGSSCYTGMFYNCLRLATAPALPATTLANYCYSSMFLRCSSLSYIKMMATDISASGCLGNWVYNVSSSGTFVKNSEATWDVTGTSGIPEGWTVETAAS